MTGEQAFKAYKDLMAIIEAKETWAKDILAKSDPNQVVMRSAFTAEVDYCGDLTRCVAFARDWTLLSAQDFLAANAMKGSIKLEVIMIPWPPATAPAYVNPVATNHMTPAIAARVTWAGEAILKSGDEPTVSTIALYGFEGATRDALTKALLIAQNTKAQAA
jgi:hypothetical protein